MGIGRGSTETVTREFADAGRCKRGNVPASSRQYWFSLNNLKTFPWIHERVEQGTLALHGWYFDIEPGELLGYDAATCRFERCGYLPVNSL